jgi:hypothetical protein
LNGCRSLQGLPESIGQLKMHCDILFYKSVLGLRKYVYESINGMHPKSFIYQSINGMHSKSFIY